VAKATGEGAIDNNTSVATTATAAAAANALPSSIIAINVFKGEKHL
jgi:hypothetical protein